MRDAGQPNLSHGLTKRLITLAVPIVIQNLVNQSLALLDTFMVGVLGETELAALTLANTWFFVINLFTFGVQSGMTVLVGQYWGRGDKNTINRLLGIGLALGGVFTIVICGFITLFPLRVMSLTTSNADIAAVAAEYARIVAPSCILNTVSLLFIGAQRAMENPHVGMRVLILSMACNTALNYVFIFGKGPFPAMGVRGAAIATLLSRMIELCCTLAFVFRDPRLPLVPKLLLRPGKILWKDYIRICFPVIANEALWGLGFSLFPVIIGHMPNSASGVSAYTIALNIERISAALYFGIGHAIAVVICKELGSGATKGIYEMGKAVLVRSALAGILAGVALACMTFFIISPYVIPLFTESESTARLARTMLYISCAAAPARAINFTIVVGILRGGGDTRAAMLIDLTSMYVLAVPLGALVGLVFRWGTLAVFSVMTVEEIWKFSVCLWRFRRKMWVRDMTRAAESL